MMNMEKTIKSFKDANKVKTAIGDLVSVLELPSGDKYESSFIVTSISKSGQRTVVYMTNDVYGEIGVNRQYVINEM
jgi:hypothetical protein